MVSEAPYNLRDLIDDRESQAAPVAGRVGYPVEALLHALALLFRNPGTGVLYREEAFSAVLAGAHSDRAARGRVLECVIDQDC